MTIEMVRMKHHNKHQIPDPDGNAAPLRGLIKHIVETHHAYLQTELPALDKLIARLAQQCPGGAILPELHRAIKHLNRELELQMRKEETILFPAILELRRRWPQVGNRTIRLSARWRIFPGSQPKITSGLRERFTRSGS
jgi:iron-sulfur cluster repair protein YtfE (RIC family)